LKGGQGGFENQKALTAENEEGAEKGKTKSKPFSRRGRQERKENQKQESIHHEAHEGHEVGARRAVPGMLENISFGKGL